MIECGTPQRLRTPINLTILTDAEDIMLAIEKQQVLANAARPESTKILPEWARVPVASRACGIGRTRLYELLNEARGKIRTCLLKSPGAERGARLIHLPSLFGYLETLAASQLGGKEAVTE
jgi:hypothetical protein